MRPLALLLLLLGVSVIGVSAHPRRARADEVAPELEGADLRHVAQAELRRLIVAMSAADQRRLVGIYVAFDDDASDPLAQVACDDDGDYVVVLSEAMLRLGAYVARAASRPASGEGSDNKLSEYAAFVARSQVPGRRLLPPPAGFYLADRSARTYEDRLSDVLSFIVARELSHLRAGDLVCPNPTAMTESGDSVWTVGEKRQASEVAQLSWMDREGKTLTTVGAPADYRNPSIDAAGERVVANTVDSADVWLLDSRRGTTSRLTFDPAVDSDAIFSPDGRWVAFYSARQPSGLYRKASSGAGADELIAATGVATYPRDWSLDGRFLLYDNGADGAEWALPMEGDRKPFRYPPSQASGSQVVMGHFSPDAKWVAYASTETGRQEVFVQDFPATGAKFQVSINGGSEPRWRSDGREFYFLGADGRMMAVEVEHTPAFRLGVPTPLFQTRLNLLTTPARRYGVSADGKRFLMNVPLGGDALAPITVILNWQTALKK